MPDLLIRNVDDVLHRRLKDRAALHRHTLEEEARELLRLGAADPMFSEPEKLADLAGRLFGFADGVELDLPRRSSAPARAPQDLAAAGPDGAGG